MRSHWLWQFVTHPVLGKMVAIFMLAIVVGVVLVLTGHPDAAWLTSQGLTLLALGYGGVCAFVDEARNRKRARSHREGVR